jgi:hypothetical protein
MVAIASREPVPEEFSAGVSESGAPRGGFRIATYGPMPVAGQERRVWASATPIAMPVGI